MKNILRLSATALLTLALALGSSGCSRHTYWGVEGDAPGLNAHYYVGGDNGAPHHKHKDKHHKKPKPPKHHKEKHHKKGKHHHD